MPRRSPNKPVIHGVSKEPAVIDRERLDFWDTRGGKKNLNYLNSCVHTRIAKFI